MLVCVRSESNLVNVKVGLINTLGLLMMIIISISHRL
jgi:hypothetical protein